MVHVASAQGQLYVPPSVQHLCTKIKYKISRGPPTYQFVMYHKGIKLLTFFLSEEKIYNRFDVYEFLLLFL